MTVLQPGQTYLRKIRLRAGRADPLAARLRLERLLSAALRHPPGLPPGAVLCVRQGRLLAGDQIAVTGPMGAALDRAVAAWLEGLVRRAARPAPGEAAFAPAVLFADQAELLACLAADWLSGALGERWWWRSLFPGLGQAQALLAGWRNAPQFQPAALERLSRGGRAIEFVHRLEPAAVRSLLEGLLGAFALTELAAALCLAQILPSPPARSGGAARADLPRNARRGPHAHHPGGARPAAHREGVPQAPALPRAAGPASPPWLSASPEAGAPGLAPVQRAYLGVGLALQRAPAAVRSAGFSAASRLWSMSLPLPPPGAAEPGAEPLSPAALTGANPAAPGIAAPAPEPLPPLGQNDRPASPAVILPPLGPASAPPTLPEAPPQAAGILAGELPLAESVETHFGGLFYLLNLAVYLGLYGDFTSPAEPGIALSPWDWLALAGRAWGGIALEADPLWALLARLAGRPAHQPPGAGFDPPAEWRLPLPWLEPFAASAAWRWGLSAPSARLSLRHSGLRSPGLVVLHPAGFPVLDVAPRPHLSLRRQLAEELAPYRGLYRLCRRRRIPFVGGSAATPASRWMGWLLAYASARLRRALSWRDPIRLIARPARLTLSAARLDVAFSLEAHPLEIRLAGLDRDLGWLPAAGYSIFYHYE